MYYDYYGLREKPFAIEPDPRFLVLMEGHREALATLVYAIEQQEGWALVVGEAGVGKTTLIMALLREVGERVVSAVITNPRLTPLDFMNQLALELGMEGPFPSKGPFLVALGQLIARCRTQGKLLLVVVDEAQDLSPEMLEELRLLGNLDANSPRALNIFLVGQPEIIRNLRKAGAKALMQRLRRSYGLKAMTREETCAYVKQRMTVAGARRDIFDEGALQAVYEVSRGIPRLINSVCDDALLLGFSRDLAQLDREVVLAAAAEDPSLEWPPSEEDLLAPAAGPAAAGPPPAEPAPGPAPAARQPQPVAPKGPAPAPPRERPAPRPAPADAPKPHPAPEPALDQPASARRWGEAPAKRGLLSRMAASLAKDAPGSTVKRLLVLVLVVGLGWGGFYLLKKNWWRIKNLRWAAAPQIVIPETPAPPAPGAGTAEKSAPDWGPLITPPDNPALSEGGDRG